MATARDKRVAADGAAASPAKRTARDDKKDDEEKQEQAVAELDNLGIAYCRDNKALLFARDRRLYVYGRQLEPWWFQARANQVNYSEDPARRLSGTAMAPACGLSENKLAADLVRELLHMVNSQAPIDNSPASLLSVEYGRLHQQRVAQLVSQALFNNAVPLHEIGFVVADREDHVGTSPDYLALPFRVGSEELLDSRGRPIVLEIKTSARRLMDSPSVEHIVQVHQEMHVCGWESFALLAGYHQEAVRVWRVDYCAKLWDWIDIRARFVLYLVASVGAPHAFDVARQCRLLHSVARDTHTWWFGSAEALARARRYMPLDRTHIPASMHRAEQAFLDSHYETGWRTSAAFCKRYLSIMPPVKPSVRLVYECTATVDSEEDSVKRDEYGLVKREYWRHDLMLPHLPPHPSASLAVCTLDADAQRKCERLFCPTLPDSSASTIALYSVYTSETVAAAEATAHGK